MRTNTYVNFAGTCAEAFLYYEKHLGAKAGMMMTDGQPPEQTRVNPDWKDAVLHARITIGDAELWAADIPKAEPMRSAYLTMAKTFFASRFAEVRDRFGINWLILHERPMPPR